MSQSNNQDHFKLREKFYYCYSCKERQSDKQSICSQCDKKFKNLDDLKTHKMDHSSDGQLRCSKDKEEQKTYSCKVCGKKFLECNLIVAEELVEAEMELAEIMNNISTLR